MIFASLFLAFAAQQPTGPYSIQSKETIELVDRVRKKTLEVRATFPKDPGKYPLIILSHGLGGSKDGLLPLSEFWARHGFIVIQPTHSDSMKYANAETRQQFLKGNLAGMARDWQSRPADVELILDSIEKVIAAAGMKSRPDMSKIGMSGHSFGAHTTMLLAGAEVGLVRKQSFRDPRIKCAVMISPQGKGAQFRENSWKNCKIPMMTISGSEDRDPLAKQDPEWRKDPYNYSPPGNKYLVWIDGANHGFGGINGRASFPNSGGRNQDMVRIVQIVSLAFWEKYLKKNDTSELVSGSNFKSGAVKYSIATK